MTEFALKANIPVDPVNQLPYSGVDYQLERAANTLLGIAEGDPDVDDERNRKRYDWRQEHRDKKIAGEVARFPAADYAEAGAAQIDTLGKAKAILENYASNYSGVLSPSRAFDVGSGPAKIGTNAHHDRLDVEVWVASQSDATKDLAYAITMGASQSDAADTFDVSQPTVSRWHVDLYESIEASQPFEPKRRRRRKK